MGKLHSTCTCTVPTEHRLHRGERERRELVVLDIFASRYVLRRVILRKWVQAIGMRSFVSVSLYVKARNNGGHHVVKAGNVPLTPSSLYLLWLVFFVDEQGTQSLNSTFAVLAVCTKCAVVLLCGILFLRLLSSSRAPPLSWRSCAPGTVVRLREQTRHPTLSQPEEFRNRYRSKTFCPNTIPLPSEREPNCRMAHERCARSESTLPSLFAGILSVVR
jgi:hypothetical protein